MSTFEFLSAHESFAHGLGPRAEIGEVITACKERLDKSLVRAEDRFGQSNLRFLICSATAIKC